MKHLKTLLLGLTLLVVAMITKADTGKPVDVRVHGYVTDAITKKPVSGVVVSASAPGIIGTTEATTDADGYFSFGQLPAQQVNLQFGKKGYQNFKKANVSAKEKTPVKLIVEFIPESKDENLDETEYPILRMLQFS
ncbi:MAG TPA: carboxypeptidase-like regulatory domain-containing protein [Puia sp.]|nr:carboxypeptidase-like regulatory domain-containing protein [Puia sp.]